MKGRAWYGTGGAAKKLAEALDLERIEEKG